MIVRPARALALFLTALACALPASTPAPAAKVPACRHPVWEVYGGVTDRAGAPVPSVRAYVLLDKVSQKEFSKQGVRARSATVTDDGRYHVGLTCGSSPDPCAAKLRHLTVIAEGRGYATTLRVFELADLEVVEDGDRCTARVPTLQLRESF